MSSYLFTVLDIDEIEYTKPTEESNYNSYAIYNDIKTNIKKNPINIQTSSVIIKDGKFKGNNKKCVVDLQFINDTKSNKFYKFINDLDDYNKNIAVKNSTEWFGEKIDEMESDDYYKSALRFNRTTDELPSLRVNVDLTDNIPNVGIFNKDEILIPFSNIKKNEKLKCVIEYNGLKFGNKNENVSCNDRKNA